MLLLFFVHEERMKPSHWLESALRCFVSDGWMAGRTFGPFKIYSTNPHKFFSGTDGREATEKELADSHSLGKIATKQKYL